RVADINPGAGGSFTYFLTNVDGTLFFTAFDGTSGGLWKSDGTAAGTVLIANVNANGGYFAADGPLTGFNGAGFFWSSSGGDMETWTSDGTAAGTFQLAQINPHLGPPLASIQTPYQSAFVVVGGQVFFPAFDGTQVGIWATDGTVAGTRRLMSLPTFANFDGKFNTADPSFDVQQFVPVNGTIFLRGPQLPSF